MKCTPFLDLKNFDVLFMNNYSYPTCKPNQRRYYLNSWHKSDSISSKTGSYPKAKLVNCEEDGAFDEPDKQEVSQLHDCC